MDMQNSLLGAGCLIENARILHSVVGLEVMMEEGVEVENCIILDYVKIERGCKLRNAIIDRFNIIKEGTRIGYDAESDKKQYYIDQGSGMIVVPCGERMVSRVY
jgi:glucose-1-phosphate adenylyltransferase